MARLWGRTWTRQELLQHVGDVSQVAGARRVVLNEGNEKGVEAAICRTGSGLGFTVLLDRGLDIYQADYCGKPLAWRSQTGDAHPSFFEPDGFGWLRTFGGGLVTTCGLTWAGAPCVDEGVALGLHGRASHIPARAVYMDGAWEGDDYTFWVQGRVVEASVFGDHLELTRRIWARLGENRIFIEDSVVNAGYRTAPHQMLYHINLGFPVVEAGAEVLLPTREATPRDAEAQKGADIWHTMVAPAPDFREQVFFHDLKADADGYVTTGLRNRKAGLHFYARYRQAELPRFAEWKMCGAGTYVLGLEPANCTVLGRAHDRDHGILQFLEPGEKREYRLELGVHETA